MKKTRPYNALPTRVHFRVKVAVILTVGGWKKLHFPQMEMKKAGKVILRKQTIKK